MKSRKKRAKTGKCRQNKIVSFRETLGILHRDFTLLVEDKSQADNLSLMNRVALHVKQLYMEAQELKASPKYHLVAEQVLLSLNTPWGAPFVRATTLYEAAEKFGQQHPKYSELHRWLSDIARYGHYFPSQILSMVG